jgi:hypothetical protein
MEFQYQENMTQEMLDCLSAVSETALKQEAEFALANLVAARKAGNISLPATAASGLPVVHGTRLVMDSLITYWGKRVDAACEFLRNEAEWLDRRGMPRGVYGIYQKYGIPVPHLIEFWNNKHDKNAT